MEEGFLLVVILMYDTAVEYTDYTSADEVSPPPTKECPAYGTKQSDGDNSVSFPFSWAARLGAWGPSLSGTWSSFQHLLSDSNCSIGGPEGPLLGAGSLYSVFSPTDFNFLLSGLYNNLTSTLLPASVTISHSIEPLDSQSHLLIFLDRMHLLFTLVHFLFWQLGRVGGQYTTQT